MQVETYQIKSYIEKLVQHCRMVNERMNTCIADKVAKMGNDADHLLQDLPKQAYDEAAL